MVFTDRPRSARCLSPIAARPGRPSAAQQPPTLGEPGRTPQKKSAAGSYAHLHVRRCTPRLDGSRSPDARPRLCAHSKTSSGLRWDEEVDGSFAILDLKALLSESCDIATEHQRLVYKGRVLQDALTLDESGTHRLSLVPGSPLPKPCAQTLCPAAPFLMPTAAPLPPSPVRRERR